MENIKKVSNDPKLFMYELRKNKKDFIFWGVAIFLVLIIFIFICSKEISVLQTLSSMTKTLSFISILLKVLNFQNCSGLSISSLLCFYISLACKILISFFSVRLRDYKVNFSNSTFINISEYSSFFIIVYLIYTSYYKYPETTDTLIDNQLPFYYICIPTFLFSIPFKPWIFRYWFIDLIWIYSIFLESVSIYPQIRLFSIKKGQIESFTSNYLILQGLSSVFGIIYWYKSFIIFNDRDSLLLGELCGYLIMLFEIIKIISMAYFYALYFKSIIKTRNSKKFDI